MNRNYNGRRLAEFHDEHCCAGNVVGNFRRTSSLRLRGEKMVQRSPLSTRKLIPVITENSHQKHRSDVARLVEPGHRQRSHSFSSNAQHKGRKSCLKQENDLDGKLNMSDSAHTPPGSPEDLPDDESLHSYGSAATAASVDAGYAPFNGTTFSGRSMRYVLHCSSHAGLAGEEYLTPTQRAQKQIRRLKCLLGQAKKDLEKKDSEIFHLTKEVVELRLYKASICSPDEKSNSSEIVTIRENADDASICSILGPLLFLIYINDLPNYANNLCETVLFADDTSLVFKVNRGKNCSDEVNSALSKVSYWFNSNNLALNPKKTKCVKFSLPNVEHVELNINLNDVEVEFTESTKFLGITLDSRLQWDPHIEALSSRLSSAAFAVKKIRLLTDIETARGYDITDSPLFKDQTPTRCRNEMQGSFTDSGHFDDLTNSSLHSKESVHMLTHDVSCMTDDCDGEEERRSLIEFYDKKIEDVMRAHVGETQELKKSHNDKVEALLQKLSDVNTRYCELLPNYEQAKERIHSLEKQLEEVSRQLQDEDARHRSMYLQMYNKGVAAAQFEIEKDEAGPSQGPVNRVSVEKLLEQLQITQTELENVRAMYRRIVESKGNKTASVDPEVTLQFLKSAIYYFLTDPENHQGHLNAIENILGFTEAEKNNIRKARAT